MAAGFPVKADYVTGDILSAVNMNDLAGTLNYLDPTAKGDLFPASSGTALTRLAVGANNTVLIADSSTATGLKWGTVPGGGKVLQLSSTAKTDTFSTASTSNVDVTGLSISITPSSTTSKILIMVSMNIGVSADGVQATAQLVRDSTAICIGDAAGSRTRSSVGSWYGASDQRAGVITFLDSPATTSATTYKIQMRTNSGTTYINRSGTDTDNSSFARTASSITVMEIGA